MTSSQAVTAYLKAETAFHRDMAEYGEASKLRARAFKAWLAARSRKSAKTDELLAKYTALVERVRVAVEAMQVSGPALDAAQAAMQAEQ